MFSALFIHRECRVRHTHGLSFRKALDAGTDQQLPRRESRYGNAFPIQSFTDLNRHGLTVLVCSSTSHTWGCPGLFCGVNTAESGTVI
jgi:hypothetical protein